MLDVLSDFLVEGKDWSVILEATATYAILIALLAPVLFQVRYRSPRPFAAAGIAASLGSMVTVIGFCTNWDIRLNDLPPAFFGLMLYLREREQGYVHSRPWIGKAIKSIALFALILVGVVSVRRARMQSAGLWAGDVSGTLSVRHDPFFGFFVARSDLWSALDLIDRDRLSHPGAKVFFGSRLEFEYARLGLESPKNLPPWWHRGSSHAIEDEPRLAEIFDREKFDTLYFASRLYNGNIRFPARLQHEVDEKYERIPSSDHLVEIYRRKIPQ